MDDVPAFPDADPALSFGVLLKLASVWRINSMSGSPVTDVTDMESGWPLAPLIHRAVWAVQQSVVPITPELSIVYDGFFWSR